VRHVKEAYAMLFIARKAIDVHLANADVLREIADVAQVKYATGRIAQQDVLKAVVELSKLHDDIISLEQQAQIAAARLNTLMNRPIDAPIGPVTDPHEQMLIPLAGQLEAAAVTNQPELRIARQQTERAEAELAVARQDYKPDYSVQAGYMLMPHQTDAVMARFGITWPNAPWARGKLDARVREMTAGADASKARERALENATRLSVREAYINVKAAEQRAALLRTTIIPQAEQALEVSRAAYQSDRIDLLPLLDNERSLLDAQLGYFRALAEFDQALASLERAVGADPTDDMLSVTARPNGGTR
jgi:outer membrane protein TolC